MSKRFGRQQKRRLKYQIELLENVKIKVICERYKELYPDEGDERIEAVFSLEEILKMREKTRLVHLSGKNIITDLTVEIAND